MFNKVAEYHRNPWPSIDRNMYHKPTRINQSFAKECNSATPQLVTPIKLLFE